MSAGRITLKLSIVFIITCTRFGWAADEFRLSAYDFLGRSFNPLQFSQLQEKLIGLGYKKELIESAPLPGGWLSAVISFESDEGSFTGSFVSDDGLILTNFHNAASCHTGSMKDDYLTALYPAFVAKSLGDEKQCHHVRSAEVPTRLTDITETILRDLAPEMSKEARTKAVNDRLEARKKECEKAEHTSCRISTLYNQTQFLLAEYLMLKDVRLAYAPQSDIVQGFGGVTRGDFLVLRAYVGKDGKPAAFNKDNKPFSPKRHLKISTAGVNEKEPVVAAGYPEMAHRHDDIALPLAELLKSGYARRVEMWEVESKIVGHLIEKSQDAKRTKMLLDIKSRLDQEIVATKALRQTMKKTRLPSDLDSVRREALAWAKEQPEWNKRIEPLLKELPGYERRFHQFLARDRGVSDLMKSSKLFTVASYIVSAVQKDSTVERAKEGVEYYLAQFDPEVDAAVFRHRVESVAELKPADQPLLLKEIFAEAGKDERDMGAVVAHFYRNSTLADPEVWKKLLTSSPEQLRDSKDPFIRLAIQWRKRGSEELDENSPLDDIYASLLRDFLKSKDVPLYHASSRLLRMTFSPVCADTTIWGYERPAAYALKQENLEFAWKLVPNKEKRLTRFAEAFAADKQFKGQLPVTFNAAFDTNQGGSGSPVLDGSGKLVGLHFATSSVLEFASLGFSPVHTAGWSVDARYILWVMKNVDRAEWLLKSLER